MTALRHVALAAALLVPAAVHAQRPVRSVSATLSVTAHVMPVLTIAGIGAAEAITGAVTPAWASLVSVRANIPHRVLVRPAGDAALRAPDGRWVPASASAPLEIIGAPGESAHRFECRGSATVCALTFELRSTDASFPMHVTGFGPGASGTTAVSSIATTS